MTPPGPDLVAKLVCPISRTRLRYDEAREELVSDEAGIAYPVRGGIPVLIAEEGKPCTVEESR